MQRQAAAKKYGLPGGGKLKLINRAIVFFTEQVLGHWSSELKTKCNITFI